MPCFRSSDVICLVCFRDSDVILVLCFKSSDVICSVCFMDIGFIWVLCFKDFGGIWVAVFQFSGVILGAVLQLFYCYFGWYVAGILVSFSCFVSGILMVFAWVLFAGMATILARYQKDAMSRLCCDSAVWFQVIMTSHPCVWPFFKSNTKWKHIESLLWQQTLINISTLRCNNSLNNNNGNGTKSFKRRHFTVQNNPK